MPILLEASLTQTLKNFALENDLDLSIVVMAGWSAVLSRLSGQDDIIIGFYSDYVGQASADEYLDATILPLQMDLSGEPDVLQLLGRAREVAALAMAHQDQYPDHSTDAINPLTGAPIFQVGFQWQRQATLKKASSSTAQVDLQLQLQESDNEVKGAMRFSSALFDTDTIKRHVGYLVTTLRSMAKDATRPIATFEILTPPERKLVLETWNKT
ncbi:hypothetical protein BGX31_002491, partial [Mortierella sp. GBA43]